MKAGYVKMAAWAAAALVVGSSPALARSPLEGLELAESEMGGVEIIALSPTSPAARASLQAGDRIVAVGRDVVKGLDDYVKISKKTLRGGDESVVVEYIRGDVRQNAELSLQVLPLGEKWGVNVIPWRAGRFSNEREGADFWIDLARRQMRENEGKGEKELGVVDYGKVLLSLFSALGEEPESVSTAMLICRQYGALASLYEARGERRKAVWCLRRALHMCGGSLKMARDIQEMVLVKKGLSDLQNTLTAMK